MSELRTNRNVPRDGLPAGASGGGIIQIVQNVQGIGQVNSSSTSEYDLGLNCTITPQSSDSKILINANWSALQNGEFAIDYYLNRGSTHIHMTQVYQNQSHWYLSFPNMVYLDSPSTISPVTYKISAKLTEASQYLYTNYNYGATDDTTVHGELTGYGSRSTMILMEISG